MVMSALDALRQDPEWSRVYDRITAALQHNGADARDDPGPPVDGATPGVLERYARAVSHSAGQPVALSMVLPTVLCAASVAGQGAYWVRVRQLGGEWLPVPGILQATMIAPSGYGKSTVLDPLRVMLEHINEIQGGVHRGQLVAQWTQHAVDTATGADPADLDRIRKVYRRGRCSKLTISSGTQEGVRDVLLAGGGVAGIMTAEADIFREVGAFSKDAGTYQYFLEGWGAGKVDVARAGRHISIPRASVPYCILLQPQAFDQFNTGRVERDGGATDSLIGKGLYGRSWLVRVEGWIGDDTAFGSTGPEHGHSHGPVAAAAVDLEATLRRVMHRSDEYRARLGVAIGYRDAASRDEDGGMPPVRLPEQIWLHLADTPECQWAYIQVQNLRRTFIVQVQRMEAEHPGASTMFMPMVSRFTQHTLRLALVLQLAADPDATVITAHHLRDAALRLLPWLVEWWTREMGKYATDHAVAVLEYEIRRNPRGAPLTFDGKLAAALDKIVELSGDSPDAQFRRAEVVGRASDTVRGDARKMLAVELGAVWDEWAKLGYVETVAGSGGGGRAGAVRYRRTPLGMAHGL